MSPPYLVIGNLSVPSISIEVLGLFMVVVVFSMEDGGVDRTVIDCWQHHLGQMADFPPLLTISVFDL